MSDLPDRIIKIMKERQQKIEQGYSVHFSKLMSDKKMSMKICCNILIKITDIISRWVSKYLYIRNPIDDIKKDEIKHDYSSQPLGISFGEKKYIIHEKLEIESMIRNEILLAIQRFRENYSQCYLFDEYTPITINYAVGKQVSGFTNSIFEHDIVFTKKEITEILDDEFWNSECLIYSVYKEHERMFVKS